MFKTTRMIWLGLAIVLGCACPEKPPVAEGPSAKPVETTPAPASAAAPAPAATGEVQPATPATPPTAGTPAATPPPANTPPETPKPAPAADLPKTAGAPCDDRGCAGDFKCVSYYGIAGPKGPQFKTCEIPCPNKGDKCPGSTKCTSIADGPGKVCR